MRIDRYISAGNKRALLLSLVATAVLSLLPIPSHAIIFFDDGFEGSGPAASGWQYTASACTSSPCPYFDVSTDVARVGSKSLKGTYKFAWNNPQINDVGIYRYFPVTTDLYLRYYYRTHAFTYTDHTKHMYYKGQGSSYPNGGSVNWWGSRELGFFTQGEAGVCPTSGAAGGPYSACNYYPNMSHVPFNDDQWYCVEEHFKLGTANRADGAVEIWVDGVQTLGYYNLPLQGSTPAWFDTLSPFKQDGDGLMYYDQVAAGTTRIGCSSSAPPSDTTPPAVPIGLLIK